MPPGLQEIGAVSFLALESSKKDPAILKWKFSWSQRKTEAHCEGSTVVREVWQRLELPCFIPPFPKLYDFSRRQLSLQPINMAYC